MPHTDRYGMELSTSSDVAAALYRTGVDGWLSSWPGAVEAFTAAIAADPEFALAYAANARMKFLYVQTDAAKADIATAKTLLARTGTDREKSHVAILALAMEGQSAACLAKALAHLT